MWNGYRRLLPWAAMPCLRCAQCTSQPLSPYSRRLLAALGVYDQHVPACSGNLEVSQQMGSPPSSHLLCSCLPLIFSSGYLGQVRPPHQPSGKKEMPHSSLSTWRCSAPAKGARTETSVTFQVRRGTVRQEQGNLHSGRGSQQLPAWSFGQQNHFRLQELLVWPFPVSGCNVTGTVPMCRHHFMSCLSPREGVSSGVQRGTRLITRSTDNSALTPLASLFIPDAPFPAAAPGA